MTIRPINGRVLVKPIEAARKTNGGLHLPDTAQEKQHDGRVIAVAEDATEEVAVDDRVIYKEFTGTEVEAEGKEYVLLSADDLLAKYVAADEIPE
jgi:chaperonin GroES